MTWLRWTALTTAGYALGASVSVALLGAVGRPLSPFAGGLLFILLFGGVFGLAVAVPQALGAPRGALRPSGWLLLTTLGSAIGFVLAALVGERLGDVISPTGNIVIGGATIQITTGAVLGLAMGSAQARALPGHGLDRRWIVATALGTGLGYGTAAAVLELLEVEILKANLIPSFGATVGLFVGLAQSLALRSRNRIASE